MVRYLLIDENLLISALTVIGATYLIVFTTYLRSAQRYPISDFEHAYDMIQTLYSCLEHNREATLQENDQKEEFNLQWCVLTKALTSNNQINHSLCSRRLAESVQIEVRYCI